MRLRLFLVSFIPIQPQTASSFISFGNYQASLQVARFTRYNTSKPMGQNQNDPSSSDDGNGGGGAGTKSKCVPCESLDPSSLLTLKQAEKELSALPSSIWKSVIGSESDDFVPKIHKSFTAKNFQAALDAINAIGVIAEREGHHPDLHLTSYREVEVVIYTHSVGGLTMNDVTLAKMIEDEVQIMYSPKWLRENPDAAASAIGK
jgi:pterin-4a-carbinolamine dehydratase